MTILTMRKMSYVAKNFYQNLNRGSKGDKPLLKSRSRRCRSFFAPFNLKPSWGIFGQ
jgi:hypothetical protein